MRIDTPVFWVSDLVSLFLAPVLYLMYYIDMTQKQRLYIISLLSDDYKRDRVSHMLWHSGLKEVCLGAYTLKAVKPREAMPSDLYWLLAKELKRLGFVDFICPVEGLVD